MNELGIPDWLKRLEETLFGEMPNDKREEFRLKFLKSIPKGFDNWQHIYHQICLYILEKECKNTDYPLVKQAISDIITLHKTEETDQEKWSAAEAAARSAADSAWTADSARSAGFAAWAIESAGFAARAAARAAAESAVDSARSATETAAWAIDSARSATETAAWSAAGFAAWAAANDRIANKLLTLLKEENT